MGLHLSIETQIGYLAAINLKNKGNKAQCTKNLNSRKTYT